MHDHTDRDDEIPRRWLEPPLEPRWELEPRWSLEDRERLANTSVRGPGLASVRDDKVADDKSQVG